MLLVTILFLTAFPILVQARTIVLVLRSTGEHSCYLYMLKTSPAELDMEQFSYVFPFLYAVQVWGTHHRLPASILYI